MQIRPTNPYNQYVDRRIRELAPDWEPRIGATALHWAVASWVHFRLGWLIAVIGLGIMYLLGFSGAPDKIIHFLTLLVVVATVVIMYPGITAARRHTKATMQYLGLPAKPVVTAKAMQSPEDFDVWLLKTREYHRLKNETQGKARGRQGS